MSAMIFTILFLAPAVEPAEVFAVPVEGVLWLENPVVLVGEDDEAGRDAHELGGVVGGHAFIDGDTEVHAAVGDEDRGVPGGDELVR